MYSVTQKRAKERLEHKVALRAGKAEYKQVEPWTKSL